MSNTVYQERDIEELGVYYIGHVIAMTRDGLHSKSSIAAELAHRDKERDDWMDRATEALATVGVLTAERDELRAEVERLKADKSRLECAMEDIFVNHRDASFVKAHAAHAINPMKGDSK